MFNKIARSLLVAGALSGSGLALASEPMVLSDETLDTVAAGNSYSLPVVPTSVAFAYVFTNASSTPGLQVTIDVGFGASAGAGQIPTTNFTNSVVWKLI